MFGSMMGVVLQVKTCIKYMNMFFLPFYLPSAFPKPPLPYPVIFL